MISLFVSVIHSVDFLFHFFIKSLAHFSMTNSIPIPWLHILIVRKTVYKNFGKYLDIIRIPEVV